MAEQFQADVEKVKKDKKDKKAAKKDEKALAKQQEKEAKHEKILGEFRERVKDLNKPPLHDNDAEYRRFLVARKWDVDKAYQMFVDCLKWRENYKPENITEEQVAREVASGKGYPLGKDNKGRPAFLVVPARHDPKNANNDDILRAFIYHVEKGLNQEGVTEMSIIIDFEGWSTKNMDSDLDKMLLDAVQLYYPERLGHAYAVNPPTVFKVAWSVVKNLLDKRTTSKITFLGSSNWKEELNRHFPPESLPVKFGGTNPVDMSVTKSPTVKGAPKALTMTK